MAAGTQIEHGPYFETLQLALRRASGQHELKLGEGQHELKLGDRVGFCADVVPGAQPSPSSRTNLTLAKDIGA